MVDSAYSQNALEWISGTEIHSRFLSLTAADLRPAACAGAPQVRRVAVAPVAPRPSSKKTHLVSAALSRPPDGGRRPRARMRPPGAPGPHRPARPFPPPKTEGTPPQSGAWVGWRCQEFKLGERHSPLGRPEAGLPVAHQRREPPLERPRDWCAGGGKCYLCPRSKLLPIIPVGPVGVFFRCRIRFGTQRCVHPLAGWGAEAKGAEAPAR